MGLRCSRRSTAIEFDDHSGWHLCTGKHAVFIKGNDGNARAAAEAAERFVDHVAEKAYTITLAVSLGQINTLIENPFSTTPAVVPEEEKLRSGLQPGGSRLSLGLEDWHDRIADLQDALEVV